MNTTLRVRPLLRVRTVREHTILRWFRVMLVAILTSTVTLLGVSQSAYGDPTYPTRTAWMHGTLTAWTRLTTIEYRDQTTAYRRTHTLRTFRHTPPYTLSVYRTQHPYRPVSPLDGVYVAPSGFTVLDSTQTCTPYGADSVMFRVDVRVNSGTYTYFGSAGEIKPRNVNGTTTVSYAVLILQTTVAELRGTMMGDVGVVMAVAPYGATKGWHQIEETAPDSTNFTC